MSRLELNSNTLSVFCSRILVRASQAYLRSGNLIFHIQIWNRLRDCFLFKFILLRHICVGYTNTSFCDKLSFNPFSCTILYFDILFLTWYDFTSYSIELSMSVSDLFFHSLRICFRCIIFITTQIPHKCFGIIELWPYFHYCPVCLIMVFYSFCLLLNFR